jgi:hypothetical protein
VDDKRGVTMGGISHISVPDKVETDRFQITFGGTEPVRFRYFWFGSCKYRKYLPNKVHQHIISSSIANFDRNLI